MMKLIAMGCLVAAGVAVACAAPAKDDGGESSDALTDTIGHSRECAAAEAYEAASIYDFDTPAALPARLQAAGIEDAAHFYIPGVGDGYVVDMPPSSVAIYDVAGVALVIGTPSTNQWRTPLDWVLSCTYSPPTVDGGVVREAGPGHDGGFIRDAGRD